MTLPRGEVGNGERRDRDSLYVAPWGKFKWCEGCGIRQPFDERFTPLCTACKPVEPQPAP